MSRIYFWSAEYERSRWLEAYLWNICVIHSGLPSNSHRHSTIHPSIQAQGTGRQEPPNTASRTSSRYSTTTTNAGGITFKCDYRLLIYSVIVPPATPQRCPSKKTSVCNSERCAWMSFCQADERTDVDWTDVSHPGKGAHLLLQIGGNLCRNNNKRNVLQRISWFDRK